MSQVENSPEGHRTGAAAGSVGHAVNADPTNASTPRDAAVHPAKSCRRWLILGPAVLLVLAAAAYNLVPFVTRALRTTSTDDAYVNGHVTFVAPRVQGQVTRVLVDDNMRVSKGDLLVELDREPYQVQVDIKKAAVVNAEADLKAAGPKSGPPWGWPAACAGSSRPPMEQVDNSVALLRAKVASLRSKEATCDRARADQNGLRSLQPRAISREEFDQRAKPIGWPRLPSIKPRRRSSRLGLRSASPGARRKAT